MALWTVASVFGLVVTLAGCVSYSWDPPRPSDRELEAELGDQFNPAGISSFSLSMEQTDPLHPPGGLRSFWGYYDPEAGLSYDDDGFAYDCSFFVFGCKHRDGFNAWDIHGPERFEIEANGTARVWRDERPDALDWFFRPRAFHIEGHVGPEGETVTGTTSDGVPFEFRIHEPHFEVEGVTFFHPDFGELRTSGFSRSTDPPLLPFFHPVEKQAVEGLPNLWWGGSSKTVRLETWAAVEPTEIEAECRDGNGTLQASATVDEGLRVPGGCSLEWTDETGDGYFGPGDTLDYSLPFGWRLTLVDVWAAGP
ncbi:MAG TPA: hypothetical protein VJ874_04530 [Candidatus Thermoplasmatota archaeon]|nr:hypothetical protein [Candidatus Thermoplasmatota archaeon]